MDYTRLLGTKITKTEFMTKMNLEDTADSRKLWVEFAMANANYEAPKTSNTPKAKKSYKANGDEVFYEMAISALKKIGTATSAQWVDKFIVEFPKVYNRKVAQLGKSRAREQLRMQIQAISAKNREFMGMMRIPNTSPIEYTMV